MDFSFTKLSGVMDIPVGCLIFNVYHCSGVTGFTGWAINMNFGATSLPEHVDIPDECEDFSGDWCENVHSVENLPKKFSMTYSGLNGNLNISTRCEYLDVTGSRRLKSFTGTSKVLILDHTAVSRKLLPPDGCDEFSMVGCSVI